MAKPVMADKKPTNDPNMILANAMMSLPQRKAAG